MSIPSEEQRSIGRARLARRSSSAVATATVVEIDKRYERRGYDHRTTMPLTDRQAQVLDVLGDEPIRLAMIAGALHWQPNQVQSAIAGLALRGRATRSQGGWIKCNPC